MVTNIWSKQYPKGKELWTQATRVQRKSQWGHKTFDNAEATLLVKIASLLTQCQTGNLQV